MDTLHIKELEIRDSCSHAVKFTPQLHSISVGPTGTGTLPPLPALPPMFAPIAARGAAAEEVFEGTNEVDFR